VITTVVVGNRAQKQLARMPTRIAEKLMAWVEAVTGDGLEEVRKLPGYHDEPLKGDRLGQRSIRLSIHYRAIYEIKSAGRVEFVSIEEVSKHGY